MVINNTDGELVHKDRNQMYIWKGKNEYRTMNSDEVAMLVATSPQFVKNDWITIHEVNKE